MNDIRMKGFQSRTSVETLVESIKRHCSVKSVVRINAIDSCGRVLGEDLVSPVSVPGFNRSAMDGYALKGEETFGADKYNPLVFKVIGEVTPGTRFPLAIGNREAVRIMTGAPLPDGANAVLMAEYTEVRGDTIEITQAVAPDRNVGKIGEDIKKSEIIFRKGRQIRPQDTAIIASVGIRDVHVVQQPTVDLLITGDEILRPGEKPNGVMIVDSNSVLLRNLIHRDGGIVERILHLPDQRDEIRKAIQSSTADILCISGGASVGIEDFAASLVKELGELLVHGISMRPASPTGFGIVGGKTVFLLPGNPVSVFTAYDFFVRLVIRILGGKPIQWPYRKKQVKLKTKIVSQVGRVDYVRLVLEGDRAYSLSTSGASILSSTSRADGFLVTREESEGLAENEQVEVWLYDG